MNKWIDTDHVTRYLNRADRIPHRKEGERVLLEHLPDTVNRVLDIGTGDGRLLSMILAGQPKADGVGLDFSPVMLERARSQFVGNKNVQIVEANLDEYLRLEVARVSSPNRLSAPNDIIGLSAIRTGLHRYFLAL